MMGAVSLEDLAARAERSRVARAGARAAAALPVVMYRGLPVRRSFSMPLPHDMDRPLGEADQSEAASPVV